MADRVDAEAVDELLRQFKKLIYRFDGNAAAQELDIAWARAQEAGFWLKQAVSVQEIAKRK